MLFVILLFGFYIVIYLKYLDFNFCNDLNGKSNYLYFFQCYLQFSYHKIIHSHRIKIPFLLNTITKHRFGSDFITSVSQSVSSVTQSCLTFCDPMNRSTPGLPVHHQLPESTHTHIYWVGDAIHPSHPLSSPSPPAFNLSQHQGLFKWVSS